MLKLRLFYVAALTAAPFLPAAHAAGPAPISVYGGYNAPSEFDAKSARAFDTGPIASLDQTVKQLGLAIDRLSNHKTPKQPPNVYRVPHAELEQYVCGPTALSRPVQAGRGVF